MLENERREARIKALSDPSEAAQMASKWPPSGWPAEILLPIGGQPVSIFGHAHVSMDRSKTVSLIEGLVWTGLAPSNGQARTAILNNAVMLNRVKIKDINRILSAQDALPNIDAIVIENGKYNFGIIELC